MSLQISARGAGSAAVRVRSAYARLAPVERALPLVVPDRVRDEVVDHMLRCFPLEGVGLLATVKSSRKKIAHRFYPGRNIDASPQRYTMDPVDVFVALHDMERRRMRLLAIVHSHPETPPVPSVRDLVEAEVRGVLSVIVGLTPIVDLRAWRFEFNSHGIATCGEEVRIVELRDGRWESTRR
jgi:proteasome lid subunit RPN8/RPN11